MRWTTMRQDEGSILVLSLGFIVVCILAVAVVVDASAMFLERRSLQARADSAALAGAQAVKIVGNTEPISKVKLLKSIISLTNF